MSLSTLTIVIGGMVIGLLLGLTGGGGSIMTVPLLVYIVGLEAKIAIATSLLVVGLASLAALLPHSRAGNVYWRTGLIFGVAGMAGAYSGGRIAEYIADALLLLLFAGVMIGSGIAMLRKRGAPPGAAAVAGSPRSWWKIVGDGFVVGIVTGLVGAGGGFLVVPALALLGGLPMHAAVGTSLLVIAMKSFAGLAGYISHVPIDSESAAIVGGLAILGTLLGTRIARFVSGPLLHRGYTRGHRGQCPARHVIRFRPGAGRRGARRNRSVAGHGVRGAPPVGRLGAARFALKRVSGSVCHWQAVEVAT
jgi:uncharacterized membrane protein YfcA